MAAVLKLFWGICLLRSGPEAVPTHTWFLATLVAGMLAVGVMVAKLITPALSAMVAVNMAALGLAVTASIAWFALYVRRQEARFPATLGAVLGTGIVIDCMFLVGHELTGGVVRQALFWLCVLWNVVVVGFIFHRALACKLWGGILLSLGASAAAAVVIQAVLGPMLAVAASAVVE